MPKVRTQQEWLQLLQEFYDGALSPGEFCQRHNINVKTFRNIRRKFREQLPPPDDASSFIELKQPKTDTDHTESRTPLKTSPCLRLEAGSCQLYIPMSVKPQWIANLLREVTK